MRRRRRRAIGLGLLLPGLLLTHAGGTHADSRTAAAPAKKSTTKAEASADHKAKGRAGGPQHRRPPAQTAGPTVHVVRAGDSVSRIAAYYGVTRKSLIDANKLARPEQLKLGQRLVVPGATGVAGGGTQGGDAVQLIDARLEHGDVLLVRAGPRRVPTKFYMAPPEFVTQVLDFVWPVDGRIISPFGKRRSGWHAGMDIKAEAGTPILAAAPGVVISNGQERAYGRIIRIEHDNGFVTVYAHNLENLVEVGDRVTAGTIIATVGRTGRATTPHLHFEVRHEGMVYNPLHLLPAREDIEVRPDEVMDQPVESVRAHAADDDDTDE